jgi:drug/metabolite transporter (DMT)-like permease
MFWAWLVLAGDLMHEVDPSDNGFGQAINFLFGLPFGIAYSSVWYVIGRFRKPQRYGRLSRALSIVCWLLVALVCICFPFLVSFKYHRSVTFYLPYTALGVGPLLALSVAMVITSLRQWPSPDKDCECGGRRCAGYRR